MGTTSTKIKEQIKEQIKILLEVCLNNLEYHGDLWPKKFPE